MSTELGTVNEHLVEILKVNRVRAYEIAKQLPPGVIVKIGTRQLRVNLQALRDWIDSGGKLGETEASSHRKP